MFNYIDRSDQTQEVVMEVEGIQYRFRYHNNASNRRVNFLEVYETRPGTKKHSKPRTTRFSWVTDIPLDEKIMRAGRYGGELKMKPSIPSRIRATILSIIMDTVTSICPRSLPA